MTPDQLRIGGRYNWIEERLIYMGRALYAGDGFWYQFEKVDEPGVVWCEVRYADLAHFEETVEGDRRLVLTDLPAMKAADFDKLEARVINIDPGYTIWPAREPHKMKKGKLTKAEKKAAKRARTRAWVAGAAFVNLDTGQNLNEQGEPL